MTVRWAGCAGTVQRWGNIANCTLICSIYCLCSPYVCVVFYGLVGHTIRLIREGLIPTSTVRDKRLAQPCTSVNAVLSVHYYLTHCFKKREKHQKKTRGRE